MESSQSPPQPATAATAAAALTLETLTTIPPAQLSQAYFILAASAVFLIASATPTEARKLLADYGARKDGTQAPKDGSEENRRRQSRFISLVATVTSWGQVPHSWFVAFYGLSLACSAFWLGQFLGRGSVLGYLASQQVRTGGSGSSSTLLQVAVVWVMMVLQAGRRIYEHAAVIRPSKSTIWFVHWLLGLSFYLFVSVATWVEGSRAILDADDAPLFTPSSLFKISLATPIFCYAWINQYRCHAHLAGLKKYSLPQAGLFRRFVCPHYTCECLLYFSLALAGAPEGQLLNTTFLCAVLFVVVNLGVTAMGTRRWYADKFGQAAVAHKWNMIPFVF
ncbi:hypothetical protein QBC47DRAFT_390718 [Echria macrotheca]|uniref:Polyprenal reductase n=1 Tax=Echria macrotheca TaxID=438768 RepID=A0AAJ0B4R5_9PEZI|nr:hypothetical protein QBC47DRAFT_390718 [Echria macrotheca]